MKICKKCNKIINPKDETNHGLCGSCYYDYLLEKIDHLGEKQPEPESSLSVFSKKVKEFFKKFRKKK